MAALDRVVEWMNKIEKLQPRDVLTVPADNAILWAGDRSDVRGLAIGSDGLVVLHEGSVEGLSADGETLLERPPALPSRALGRGVDGRGMCCHADRWPGGVPGRVEPRSPLPPKVSLAQWPIFLLTR